MERDGSGSGPWPGLGTVYRWAVVAGLGLLTVFVAIQAVWAVRDILVLALVALFVAVSLDPATRWLVRHRVRRPFAVAIILLIALLSVAAVMALVGPPLVREASEIPDKIPGYVSALDERSQTFRELSDRYGLDQHLTRIAADLPQRIGTSVLNFFRRFLGVLASTLLVLVLTIYFMADLPRIRRWVPRLFPRRYQERAHQIVDVVVDKVGNYMIGGLLVSTIAAAVAYFALTLMRVPFALPLALLVFLFAFIPLIGASLAAVVCAVVAAIANGLWPNAALVLLFFVIYQQVENYIIAPRVMQGRMDLPAVGVLLAGLLGGTLLGLVGALMAIPVAAAVKAILTEVRKTAPARDSAP
ncbi:AI-2E family transporter, partial [Allorhizocola rhizosphaerae]|uniref:AI-2E family transporter n=1 Tax=Allorhizocola rhizosphaerae TaxID=1872709 RepID=UPI0013C314A4